MRTGGDSPAVRAAYRSCARQVTPAILGEDLGARVERAAQGFRAIYIGALTCTLRNAEGFRIGARAHPGATLPRPGRPGPTAQGFDRGRPLETRTIPNGYQRGALAPRLQCMAAMALNARARVPRNWWLSIGAVAASVLIASVGSCLFDGGHDEGTDHGMPLDLCHALVVSALALPALIGLAANGSLTTFLPVRRSLRFLQIPTPPPKSSLS